MANLDLADLVKPNIRSLKAYYVDNHDCRIKLHANENPFQLPSEILDLINVYNPEDYDEGTTVEFQSNTADYCPDMGLDNTILKVFIYQSKIAGIRLETWDMEVQENEIYKFVKNYYD